MFLPIEAHNIKVLLHTFKKVLDMHFRKLEHDYLGGRSIDQ